MRVWPFCATGNQVNKNHRGYYDPRKRPRQRFALDQQAQDQKQTNYRHHDTKRFSPALLEEKSAGKYNKG